MGKGGEGGKKWRMPVNTFALEAVMEVTSGCLVGTAGGCLVWIVIALVERLCWESWKLSTSSAKKLVFHTLPDFGWMGSVKSTSSHG